MGHTDLTWVLKYDATCGFSDGLQSRSGCRVFRCGAVRIVLSGSKEPANDLYTNTHQPVVCNFHLEKNPVQNFTVSSNID